jgi:ribosomal protein S12 methylthiotransferase
LFNSSDISYYIISLGCSKNQVDSERLNGALAGAGYVPAPDSERADIIIINTCGFITAAKQESIEVIFDAIGQQKRHGGENPKPYLEAGRPGTRDFGRRVAVAGCLSQRYPDALAQDIPEIDYLHGLTDGFVAGMSRKFGIAVRPVAPSREPLLPGLAYSYIKIAEGCSNNCSYCAIPLIRGPHASCQPELILEEARREVARGAKELIVVAQDIAAYRSGGTGLAELAGLLSGIGGAEWVRLMYCHPDHLDDQIIGALERGGKIVPYIDIPLQHASGRVLRSMGRKGDAEAHLSLVAKLRERVPRIRIRSTFMVGYPGETDADFAELEGFLREARLDRVGAFTYSPEEGTRAYDLGDTVPGRVKARRYDRLMAVQRDISAERLSAMAGETVRVLVEERVDDGTWAGRTEYDAPEVDGIFYLTARGVTVNSIVTARVTGAAEYDLQGELA